MSKRPLPTGEYKAGTTTFTVITDRDDVLSPGSKRIVPSRVYYPVEASAVKDMERERYMTREMAWALRKYMNAPVNYDKETNAGNNVTECYKDAPFIEGKRFPLVIFNHGYSSFREGNSFLCLELVSHGYVVISVGHPYEAACTEPDDGTKIYYDKTLTKKMYDPFLGGVIAALRLSKAKGTERELAERFEIFQNKYCKAQMLRLPEWEEDTMAAVGYAKENLSHIIDFSCGIGATGHSFGGDTAYSLCIDHKEFVCGINIDGGLFGDYNGKILDKPFLQINCETNAPICTRTLIDHKSPVWEVIFKKMKHIGFSDIKHQIPFGSVVGKLDPDIAHENVCRCHLEFFDAYLKKVKEEPDIMSNDRITVKKYEPDV